MVQYAAILSDNGLIGEAIRYTSAALALATQARRDCRAPPLHFLPEQFLPAAQDAHMRLQSHATVHGVPALGQTGASIFKRVGSFLDSKVMKLISGDVMDKSGAGTSLAASNQSPRGVQHGCFAWAVRMSCHPPTCSRAFSGCLLDRAYAA
jgi:hypothetical protein